MSTDAPAELSLPLAEDECDRLDTLVSDVLTHEVAGRVAQFAMLVGAMTETEEALKPVLREAIKGLVSTFSSTDQCTGP